MTEKDVQRLVATFPWLLDVNYQSVPELPNKGMELSLEGEMRIDLILREQITNRPVVVEFKAIPFYRENIGQILEYRARIISQFQTEDSRLYKLFGGLIAAPIMTLVVPKCDEYARIACNMSSVNLYEYQREMKKWVLPEKRPTLQQFGKALNESDLPLTPERRDVVEKIDSEILTVLSTLKADYGFIKHRNSRDQYYYPMENCFINKWLFPDEEVSIGIYEGIFSQKYDRISIEFYSKKAESLKPFEREVRRLGHKETIRTDEQYKESYLTLDVNKRKFLKDPSQVLRPYLKAYLKCANAAAP